ncbi:MAG: endonuclease [Candidatus Promineifilaceae bacterium]|jgi:endonuclease I/V8-like Glu-specific endopeptidase
MDMIDKLFMLSKEVEDRYDARAAERAASLEQIEEGNMLDAQDDHVRARLQRLNIDPDTHEQIMDEVPGALGSLGIVDTIEEDVNVLERILGFNDLIPVHFLEKGWLAARAVGRIHISSGLGFGTGFMISPRLLLTNNHVLPDRETAAHSYIEFDYQLGVDGRLMHMQEFDFMPDELFITDPDLDFTLVAVNPLNTGEWRVASYGWLPLIADEDKVIVGEKLNIIQHPSGERKQLAFRENLLEDILDNFLQYKTDTAPGSSGAPVFNDQWEVVALHHSGVPKKDADGNYLTLDGGIWNKSMPVSQLAWKANEGIRISRIIKFVDQQMLPDSAVKLWEEAKSVEKAPIPNGNKPQIGGTQTVGQHAVKIPTPDSNLDEVPDELAGPLAELQAFSERVYYDSQQDEQGRKEYYGTLAPNEKSEPAFDLKTADGWHIIVARQMQNDGEDGQSAPTFEQLQKLLEETHTTRPKYDPTKEVYPWIDLHEDGKIRSIYSGKVYDPADFISEDFAVEQARTQQLLSYRAREEMATEADIAAFEMLLEAQLPYNCEHVVPQSWFSRKEPMKGDLHHLFACESGCNSFRSNIPYYDFEDFGEATRSECGKRVGNKFEPDAGKGAIARAVFYFLVRYPGLVGDQADEFEQERLPFLLAWHNHYPVTVYERHRNQTIFAKQGNRNPFIDFPQWVNHVDFSKGFG